MKQVVCSFCRKTFRVQPCREFSARWCSVECRSEFTAATASERLTYAIAESGCWLWTGPIDRAGYGKTSYRGKHLAAHRLSYFLSKGKIPDGLQIDHLCRVRNCINPAHLEAVTPLENTLRARKDHCKQGHPFADDNLVWTQDGKHRRCRECTRRHGYAAYLKRRNAPKPEQLSFIEGDAA